MCRLRLEWAGCIMRRPMLKARVWTWKSTDIPDKPGIGLFLRNDLRGHVTTDEARALADMLHDLADQIDATNQEK